MSVTIELVLRITVASVAGALLGLEREVRGHDPGIRTHALVAMGAALFTVSGAYGFSDVRLPSADPSRLAAQVAAGVGFIGAGAVLRSGGSVKGLTTAATLWLAASLGVAAGAGAYGALAATIVAALVVLVCLPRVKPRLGRLTGASRRLHIEYQRGHGTLGPLMRDLRRLNCRVGDVQLEDDDDAALTPGVRRASLAVQGGDVRNIGEAIEALRARPEVVSIDMGTAGRRAHRDRHVPQLAVRSGMEAELQYIIDSDGPPIVPIELAGASLHSSHITELVDVYFDSPDLGLRKAGCPLRVRSETGRAPRLTWKGPAMRTGAVKQREEREVEIDHVPTAGDELRALLVRNELWNVIAQTAPAIEQHDLEPIGPLINHRSLHCYQSGSHRFELAWDRMSYPIGAPEVRIEVEAKSTSAVHLLHKVDIELHNHFGDTLQRPRRGKVKELCARLRAAPPATEHAQS